MINLCGNPVARLCATMMLDLHNIGPDADITVWDAISTQPSLSSAINLCVDIQHASNNKIQGWSNRPWTDDQGYVVVECEDPTVVASHLKFYDFMWNRSKAYYTQRPWSYRPWYYTHPDNFLLQETSNANEKNCLFVSPTKPNTEFRKQLSDVIQRYNGYSNTVLYPNSKNPDATRVIDIIGNLSPIIGYSPVHNAYYRETFFSIYVETIYSGTTQFVSEKTLDPLIKGHFILPFSTCGFVKYLKAQGWRLPDFIDYSYDQIHDDRARFRAYTQEVSRLCSINLDTWRQLWLDNIEIIEYNRNQLYNRPYDYLELLNEN